MSFASNDNNIISFSYSQLNNYFSCPYRWKLNYIDKYNLKTITNDNIFGSAMHIILQKMIYFYLNDYYSFLSYDYIGELKNIIYNIANELIYDIVNNNKNIIKDKNNISINDFKENSILYLVNLNEMENLIKSAKKIIKYIIKNDVFKKFIPNKSDYILIGSELEINEPVIINDKKTNINYRAFIDLVLKNVKTNEFIIIDIKTSFMGWKKNKLSDFNIISQLLFYKKILYQHLNATNNNVDINNIKTYYLVLKKNAFNPFIEIKEIKKEKPFLKESYTQLIEISSGKKNLKKLENNIFKFINSVFVEKNGYYFYNKEKEYDKKPSRKNCENCIFFNFLEICNRNKKNKK